MLQVKREGGSPAKPDRRRVLAARSVAAGDPPSRSGSARQSALFLPCSDCAQHLLGFSRHTVGSAAERHNKTVIKTARDLRGSGDVSDSITRCARSLTWPLVCRLHSPFAMSKPPLLLKRGLLGYVAWVYVGSRGSQRSPWPAGGAGSGRNPTSCSSVARKYGILFLRRNWSPPLFAVLRICAVCSWVRPRAW
jgi:hypothetical protein